MMTKKSYLMATDSLIWWTPAICELPVRPLHLAIQVAIVATLMIKAVSTCPSSEISLGCHPAPTMVMLPMVCLELVVVNPQMMEEVSTPRGDPDPSNNQCPLQQGYYMPPVDWARLHTPGVCVTNEHHWSQMHHWLLWLCQGHLSIQIKIPEGTKIHGADPSSVG